MITCCVSVCCRNKGVGPRSVESAVSLLRVLVTRYGLQLDNFSSWEPGVLTTPEGVAEEGTHGKFFSKGPNVVENVGSRYCLDPSLVIGYGHVGLIHYRNGWNTTLVNLKRECRTYFNRASWSLYHTKLSLYKEETRILFVPNRSRHRGHTAGQGGNEHLSLAPGRFDGRTIVSRQW